MAKNYLLQDKIDRQDAFLKRKLLKENVISASLRKPQNLQCTSDKLEELNKMTARNANDGSTISVMIDGGMNQDTSKLVRTAGADILVAGTFLFGHESMSSAKDLLLGANA